MGKYRTIMLYFMMPLVLLLGCKEEQTGDMLNNNAKNNESDDFLKEEVTLTIMMWDNWGQGFEENVKNVIEEEFPNIKIENIGGDTYDKESIEEALTAGIVPDIIFSQRQSFVESLEEFELGYDMTELIEKHNFDISRYDPEHLDEWRSWTDGELWLLPFMADRYALHYNKEIFDLFGVDYPTDGMTWPEVIDLAKEVTGERDGVQYQGLQIAGGGHLALTQVMGDEQLIDPETDEVLWVDNPYVKDYLEMIEEVNSIPGNVLPEESDAWIEDQTLAMQTLWLNLHTPENLDFDIVTFPQWEEAPNIGPLAGGWALGITKPSENKDAAMIALKHLYSDEYIGNIGDSPLHAPFPHLFTEDVDLDDLLGWELMEKFRGKNLEALFKLKPTGGPRFRSKYDLGAINQIQSLEEDFLESGLDVNTFLREIKEKEEIRIMEEKGMK